MGELNITVVRLMELSLPLSPSGGQYLSLCQTDCASLYHSGVRRSGVYNVVLLPGERLPVYCDMETDGETRQSAPTHLEPSATVTPVTAGHSEFSPASEAASLLQLEKVQSLTTACQNPKPRPQDLICRPIYFNGVATKKKKVKMLFGAVWNYWLQNLE